MEIKVSDSEQKTRSVVTQVAERLKGWFTRDLALRIKLIRSLESGYSDWRETLKLEEECLSKKQSTEQHDVLRGNYKGMITATAKNG